MEATFGNPVPRPAPNPPIHSPWNPCLGPGSESIVKEKREMGPSNSLSPNNSQDRLAQLNHLAAEAMRQKDFGKCIEFLKQASGLAPNNWNILINIAQLSISRFEFEIAEQYYEKAIKVTKDEASVCALAVPCFFNARQNNTAIKFLNRMLKLNPKSIEVLTFLATIYEHQGGMTQTAELIDKALSLDSNYDPALLIQARLYRKDARPSDAENCLRRITSKSNLDPAIRAQAWCELGKLLDSKSMFDEAISAFMSAKALLLPHSNKSLENRRRTQAHSSMMVNSISVDTLKRWNIEASTFSPRHRIALLGGHPRSGTTLLEQILDAHPEVKSIEESSIFFNNAYLPLILNSSQENHFKALDSISVQQLNNSRNTYFNLAGRFLGAEIGNSLLIDKNPSLTPFFPAFERIFPESKFLIALRDPRDVCLSSFMQYLPDGPVASAFLTLEETVNEYVSLMGAWQTLKLKIQSPYLEVRYEDLVSDLEPSARRVLEFLEIPWDPRVLNFNQHAKGKSVHSPTYADVIKPIYRGAIGRWKNYKKYFDPYLERLEPFVKAFGYE